MHGLHNRPGAGGKLQSQTHNALCVFDAAEAQNLGPHKSQHRHHQKHHQSIVMRGFLQRPLWINLTTSKQAYFPPEKNSLTHTHTHQHLPAGYIVHRHLRGCVMCDAWEYDAAAAGYDAATTTAAATAVAAIDAASGEANDNNRSKTVSLSQVKATGVQRTLPQQLSHIVTALPPTPLLPSFPPSLSLLPAPCGEVENGATDARQPASYRPAGRHGTTLPSLSISQSLSSHYLSNPPPSLPLPISNPAVVAFSRRSFSIFYLIFFNFLLLYM